MRIAACLLYAIAVACRQTPANCQSDEAAEQVRRAEAAFAETMARRDIAAFASFLAADAVFVGDMVLRGPAAIQDEWSRFFSGDTAPFSWEPEIVVVLESGDLALSSGPVYDPHGVRIGTFNSIWRRERDGRWKIVFDKGCPPCDCGGEPETD